MMVHIPNVLTNEQVARCRAVMERGRMDRRPRLPRATNPQKVKNNLQLPETAPRRASSATWCCGALARNNLFFLLAVLPKQVFPPLFNRYDAGMVLSGPHVDNAIREGSLVRIRQSTSRLDVIYFRPRVTTTSVN